MNTNKVNLDAAFAQISEYWSPRIAAELNGQHVKLAKVKGSFDWHHHPDEDELFLVIKGALVLQFRDRDDVTLQAGELYVVPCGVEHRPVAEEEVHLMLFEPVGTLNTGNVHTGKTKDDLEWVGSEP